MVLSQGEIHGLGSVHDFNRILRAEGSYRPVYPACFGRFLSGGYAHGQSQYCDTQDGPSTR